MPLFFPGKAELESLDPIGYMGVNVTSAGLSAQYEKMWRVSFVGSTVEGDVETMQVNCCADDGKHIYLPDGVFVCFEKQDVYTYVIQETDEVWQDE